MLGDYHYAMPFSVIELHQRSAIPNDVAALPGRRFVSASETNDGTRLNDPVFGTPTFYPSVETVQEFRVETQNFSSELSRVAGGQGLTRQLGQWDRRSPEIDAEQIIPGQCRSGSPHVRGHLEVVVSARSGIGNLDLGAPGCGSMVTVFPVGIGTCFANGSSSGSTRWYTRIG